MTPSLKLINWSNGFVQFIIISILCALAVPVIEVAIDQWPDWSHSWEGYWLGLIYAACIGGILRPLSPWVWNKSCRFNVVLRWPLRVAFSVAGTAIGCLFAGLVPRAIFGPAYRYWHSFQLSFQISLVLSGLIILSFAVHGSFKSKLEASQLQIKEKEVEREKALKLATEATLSSLESRMHPHFLFNTINSISSLIQEDPARAEKMLSQMADLLRFSLDSARSGLVPLSRELKIVHGYLEIERARFESRLRYQIEIPADFADVPLPPLSLQTLVENSIKYAVSVTRNGADIAIRGHRDGSQVVISVEDNGPGFDASSLPAGHGLSSLTARLESLYQGAAKLRIGSKAGITTVALQIPAASGAKR